MSDDKKTRRLRRLIERSERCQFWGQWYTVVPRLIARVFGDGKKLLCVTPLATRPNYFVVRVDSKLNDPRDPAPSDSEWRARGACDVSLLEEIMLAAEDEYGRFGIDEDTGEEMKRDDGRGFPVVDWGVGCVWGEPFPVIEWKPTPSPRRGRAAKQPMKVS